MQFVFDADLATKFGGMNRDYLTVEELERIQNKQEVKDIWKAMLDNHDCTNGPEDGCDCTLLREKLELEAWKDHE